MKFWIDAQLPPQLAQWLMITFAVEATSLRELGLRDAQDLEIFENANIEGIVIITKDSDFIELVTRFGTPPQILWITCGNVTNRNLKMRCLLKRKVKSFSDILPTLTEAVQRGLLNLTARDFLFHRSHLDIMQNTTPPITIPPQADLLDVISHRQETERFIILLPLYYENFTY